ncbi:MAG: histidine phosphatase family protein [Acidimicrobiales bacterium]
MTDDRPSFPQTLFQPEPGSAQVLLIRHGQSAPFVPGRPFDLIDGHGDPHLTERGVYQASLVGERLRTEPISAVYASTLTRTQQTASPLAGNLGFDVKIEPDLREVFLGDWEGGLLRQKQAEGHPAAMAARTNREWSEIPGAESNEALTTRTVAAVSSIAAAHPDELVAAFCHGGVIGAVLGHAAGVNPFTFNGSRHTAIAHVVIQPTGWVIRSFNDASHAGRLTSDYEVPGPLGSSAESHEPGHHVG